MVSPAVYVMLLAGAQSVGFVGGTGNAASFNYPIALAADASGNVYVADEMNNAIRKISPRGVVTTLAGSGTAAYADGAGKSAMFNDPHAVAVDSSGNVFVADTYNNRIRKITPEGVVSTVAGSSAGDADGTGTAARFGYPRGIALDPSGNLIIADSYNNKIRKITPAGVVSTLAGGSANAYGNTDGAGAAARFSFPTSVAVDAAGYIYVADLYNNLIRKVTPQGVVSTLAGGTSPGYADGPGSAASFSSPYGVGVDAAGIVYVGDSTNNRVRQITPDGMVSTLAGDGTVGWKDGPADAAEFDGPRGVAVDPAGTIYVADTGYSRIRKITRSNMTKRSGDGQTGPLSTALPAPFVVIVRDAIGRPVSNVSVAFAITTGTGTLSHASALTGADGTASTVLTTGNALGTCRVTASTGDVLLGSSLTFSAMARRNASVSTFAGSGTEGYVDGDGTSARFSRPGGLAFDADGNLYVADIGNYRIRKITAAGQVSTFAGAGTSGTASGTASAAQFQTPAGVAVDSNGNVYVGDASANQIRKIASGSVSNFCGAAWPSVMAMEPAGGMYVLCLDSIVNRYNLNATLSLTVGSGSPGYADGQGTSARFQSLAGIALDASNNAYVTDRGNHRIRKITPAGVVSTLAGPPLTGGPSALLYFANPSGIVVDSSGTIYVADNGGLTAITSDGVTSPLNVAVPAGSMVMSAGIIFVSDNLGAKILKITLSP